jgi:phage gp29-like protein
MFNFAESLGKALRGMRRTEIATRSTSSDFRTLGSFLPDPDLILQAINEDQTIYDSLLTDAHLSAAIVSRKAGVQKFKWSLDQGTASSRQLKVFQEQYARLDIQRILDQVLNGFLRGYQPMEILWDNTLLADTGKLWAKDIVAKPPEWFVFDNDNVLRFKSKNASFEGELLPPNHFITSRYQPSYKNPYGTAELSKCYWPVIFKQAMVKFWVTYGEKYGMPFAIAYLPRSSGSEEYDRAVDQLENLIQDACAAFPENTKIELLEAKGKQSSIDVYERFIRWCNSEISKAILGHTGALDSTPGKLGSEDAALQVRDDIILMDKHMAEQTMNEFNAIFNTVNFGGPDYPLFILEKEYEVDVTLAERDKILFDIGWRPTAKYIVDSHGMEEDDFTLKADEPEPEPGDDDKKPGTPVDDKQIFSRFAAKSRFKDQHALDMMQQSITDAQLQMGADQFLKPIFKLFEAGKSYEDIFSALRSNSLFDSLDTSKLDDLLTKAVFVSEVAGHLSAGQER